MGQEHDKFIEYCGCVKHHEYNEACGMGEYNSRYWTVKCNEHLLLESATANQKLAKSLRSIKTDDSDVLVKASEVLEKLANDQQNKSNSTLEQKKVSHKRKR
jgi:hypothetical protein